jgi:serine/threonine protein kinase
MTPERWKIIKAILNDVLEAPPDERVRVVEARCGDDVELRREVEELLGPTADSLDLIGSPAFAHALGGLPIDETTAPGALIGPYRIHDLIGRGGMGDVYRATDTRLGRQVALKSLKTELAASGRFDRQMLHEARAAALLSHPNIVAIFDVLEEDGRTHVVMELLEGEALDARLARGPLTEPELAALGLELTAALTHAHDRGVLHCDIKPGNIFLLPNGRVKMLDFGLARPLQLVAPPDPAARADAGARPSERRGSITAALIRHAGTPRYMAPEQLAGGSADARSDLYSAALVLLDACGARPSGAASIDPLQALDAMPHDWLRPVLRRALAPRPEERFPSVAAFTQTLERAASAAGLLARKGSPFTTRFAAAVASLALIVGGVCWWLQRSATGPEMSQILVPKAVTSHGSTFPVSAASLSNDGQTLAYGDDRGIWFRPLNADAPALVPNSAGYRLIRWLDTGRVLVRVPGRGLSALDVKGASSLVDQVTANRLPSDVPDVALEVAMTGEWILRTRTDARTLLSTTMTSTASWGPGARYVLAVTSVHGAPPNQQERRELRAYEVPSLKQHRLVALPDGVLHLPFTALPGGRVWYALAEADGSALWELRVDPSTGASIDQPRKIAFWPSLSVRTLAASGDGRRVAFLAAQGRARVLVAEGTSSPSPAFRRLTADDASEALRGWSPDGSAVFFESFKGERATLYRQAVGADVASRIEDVPPTLRVAAVLSDQSLVYETKTDRPFAAEILRRAAPRASASAGAEPPTAWRMSGFGLECLRGPTCYASDPPSTSEPRRFFRLDAASGATETLATLPSRSYAVAIAPSGRSVAYVENDWLIVIRSLDGGARRTLSLTSVIPALAVGDAWPQVVSLAWSSDEQGFYVGHRPLAGSRRLACTLYFVAMNGAGHEVARDACRALPSPDGRHVAIETVEVTANAWILDRTPAADR